MAALTNYGEEKLSKHLLGITSFTMPAALYISLHTADPTETGATGEITAGSYTYARQPASFQWDAGNSWTETSALIRWDNLPTNTISHWALWDASTAGNALVKGAFTASKSVVNGDSLEIAAQALYITMD